LTSATSLASTLSMYFFKKLSNPDGLIIIGTKIMTSTTGHFWGNGYKKSNFSLIHGTLSDRGC
jgi:hypothetical protein